MANKVVIKDTFGVERKYDTPDKVKLKSEDGELIEYSQGASGVKPEERVMLEPNFSEGNQIIKPTNPEGVINEIELVKPYYLSPEWIHWGVSVCGVEGKLNPAKEIRNFATSLNLANGNQIVNAAGNTVMTQLTILKPNTLISSNIKNGVDIGGVVGNMQSPKLEEHKTISLDNIDFSAAPIFQVYPSTSNHSLSAVDIDIGSSLRPNIIKEGETICGITGSYDGTDGSGWGNTKVCIRDFDGTLFWTFRAGGDGRPLIDALADDFEGWQAFEQKLAALQERRSILNLDDYTPAMTFQGYTDLMYRPCIESPVMPIDIGLIWDVEDDAIIFFEDTSAGSPEFHALTLTCTEQPAHMQIETSAGQIIEITDADYTILPDGWICDVVCDYSGVYNKAWVKIHCSKEVQDTCGLTIMPEGHSLERARYSNELEIGYRQHVKNINEWGYVSPSYCEKAIMPTLMGINYENLRYFIFKQKFTEETPPQERELRLWFYNCRQLQGIIFPLYADLSNVKFAQMQPMHVDKPMTYVFFFSSGAGLDTHNMFPEGLLGATVVIYSAEVHMLRQAVDWFVQDDWAYPPFSNTVILNKLNAGWM